MANALKLLEKKGNNLKERLRRTKESLVKISRCGDEMEGNTTANEEDEFIDALKDEMPEVFKNIEANFDQLDKVKEMLEHVEKTQSIEAMTEAKRELDDAAIKVEQSESLTNRLENEIVEWNAHKKLVRRDQELQEIEDLLGSFREEVEAEIRDMNAHQVKQKYKLEVDPEDKEVPHVLEGLKSYLDQLHDINEEASTLNRERTDCFEEFDAALPSPVKEERKKRWSAIPHLKKRAVKTTSDQPSDMYYQISVNCKYRQRIHDMLKALRSLNKKRRNLESSFAELRADLNQVVEFKQFKAVKGDAIDELWCYHCNKHQLKVPVKRVEKGKYMFGSRSILAKIINGKLVIRVGGGYMSADEFIEQYGQIEMLKLLKAQGEDVSL